jgi:hypothetical protein
MIGKPKRDMVEFVFKDPIVFRLAVHAIKINQIKLATPTGIQAALKY